MAINLSISLLGGFSGKLDARPINGFESNKVRALLAYLILLADRPHDRDELAGLLWPESPNAIARKNLRQALNNLRHVLQDQQATPSFLVITPHEIQFNPQSSYWVDVHFFNELLKENDGHSHRKAVSCQSCFRRYQLAIDLYHGDFLSHFYLTNAEEFNVWAETKRTELRLQALTALEKLADHAELYGEYADLQGLAERQLEIEPWHEKAHRQKMRALALRGSRTAALAHYRSYQQILKQELDTEPETETLHLYQKIRSGSLHPRHVLEIDIFLGDFRPSSPLLGRERELSELVALLENPACRLITVLGPGGIGKTRLAFQASLEIAKAFDHGVYFVPLESTSSPESLTYAIAEGVHFSFAGNADPKAQLLSYLHQKEILLFLDSFEHLLPTGSKFLTELLRIAPGITMLITSRERLNIHNEWIYDLQGLTYPIGVRAEDISPMDYGALKLFLHQAQKFSISTSWEKDGEHVIKVCELVEGMPLAIELATSWLRTLSCQEIAAEIVNDLKFLVSDKEWINQRHRSIHATFEYSWQLLTDEERRVLKGLSIFWGSFHRDAAEKVVGCNVTTLSSLVNKSLLMHNADNRYHLHALIRQYAGAHLQVDPQEATETRERYSQYYAEWLQQLEQRLKGADQQSAVTDISLEYENLHQTWIWAVQNRRSDILSKMIQTLFWYYEIKSLYTHAIATFAEVDKVFCRPGETGEHLPPIERKILGQALAYQVYYSLRYGQIELSKELIQRSLILLGPLDEPLAMSDALFSSGALQAFIGNFTAAEEDLNASYALLENTGDQWRISSRMLFLGMNNLFHGYYSEAYQQFKKALDGTRKIRDPLATVRVLSFLGPAAFGLQDFDEAEMIAQETIERAKNLDDRWSLARGLEQMGLVYQMHGDYAGAQSFFKESLVILDELEDRWGGARVLYMLGLSTIMLQDRAGAWKAFLDGFSIAIQSQSMELAMDFLVELASLLFDCGEFKEVIPILETVLYHPATGKKSQKRAVDMLDTAKMRHGPYSINAISGLSSQSTIEDIQALLFRQRFTKCGIVQQVRGEKINSSR